MLIPVIVIDSNVVGAALHSDHGVSSRLIELCGEGLFEHVLSVPLTFEYEAVCRHCIEDPIEAGLFLDFLVETSTRIPYTRNVRPFSPDPNDDMVVEAALGGKAEYIVTYNKRHFAGTERYGISVIRPDEFLTIIGR